jgi:hypothetical protein
LVLKIDSFFPDLAHEQHERIVPPIEIPTVRLSVARVVTVESADQCDGL